MKKYYLVFCAFTLLIEHIACSDGADKNPDKRWNYKEMLANGAVAYDKNVKPEDVNSFPDTNEVDPELGQISADLDLGDLDLKVIVEEDDEDEGGKKNKQSLKDLLVPSDGFSDIQKDSAYDRDYPQPSQYGTGCHTPYEGCQGCGCTKHGEIGDPGELGRVGLPGLPGPQGADGETGQEGVKGHKGEDINRNGWPGIAGDKGFGGIEGYPGSSGPTGGVGIKGRVGLRGEQGLKGQHGSKGEQGVAALPGLPGFEGDIGFLGDNGFNGIHGMLGDHGLRGETGFPGRDGRDGSPGLTGSKGPPGPRGYSGTKGSRGGPGRGALPGPKGYPGLTGRKGASGPYSDGKGPPGERGIEGRKGGYGPGPTGYKGAKGDPGPRGTTGRSGRPGPKGQRGETGDPGYGYPGDKGAPGRDSYVVGPVGFPGPLGISTGGGFGPRGRPGLPGDTLRGLPGRPGPTGPRGPKGEKAEPGNPGPPGSSGSRGRTGRKGRGLRGGYGSEGLPGDPGFGPIGPGGRQGEPGDVGGPGLPGLPGRPGFPGPHGGPGSEGNQGPDGVPGYPGDQGYGGGTGHPGTPGYSVFLYSRHSQSDQPPRCPHNHPMLWTGYSLLHTEDEGRAYVQDLGAAGSCIQKFSPMPFMFCDKKGICSHARRTATTYYLSTDKPAPMMPVDGYADIMPYISRCVVCFSRKPIIAVHSQSTQERLCPLGFQELWSGYSFVMHAVGEMGGGQPLSSPGSCLEEFRASPYVECNGKGECHYFQDKFSYWMVNVDTKDKSGQVVKPFDTYNHLSKCKVCVYEKGIPGF